MSTILEISLDIVDIIDKYMGREINRDIMINELSPLIKNNNKKIFKADDYAVVLIRKLGKKRFIVFKEVVKEIGFGKSEEYICHHG